MIYNSKMQQSTFFRLFWLSLFVIAASTAGTALAEAPPQRIVSLNLCADQLLQSLADPQTIAGLSPLARDPKLSYLAKDAESLPLIAPKSEALFTAKPDLVLLAPYEHHLLRARLQQDGIAVFMLPAWTTLAEGETQIRALAKRLGQDARGDMLINQIRQALHNSHQKIIDTRRSALEIERRLYTPGRTSLIAALLQEWNVPNLAEGLGLEQGGFVALEKLVLLKPDRLIISNGNEEAEKKDADKKSQANKNYDEKNYDEKNYDDMGLALLRHPALSHETITTISLPARLTLCGGPATPALIEALSSALQ